MINLFVYDTANGRIIGQGSYDERGDGAGTGANARGIRVGNANPQTQYAPAGVLTPRPMFNFDTLLLDKSSIVADATDAATISGVPNGTIAKVFKDQDVFPRGVTTITDGSLVLRVDTAGVYTIELENFPTQITRFQVTAT